MRSLLFASCWVTAVILGGSASSAAGSELSKFLHEAFTQEQGRAPSGAEMNYYSNLSRTAGPLESYIAMVSSYDYFVVQCQQNAEVYVTRLHQVFLHRSPRPDELRFWVNQYRTGGGDRAAFVRQFCAANNIYVVPGSPTATRPVLPPPSTRSALADSLVTKVVLLNDLIRRELGGTRFGNSLLADVAALQSTSIQYRDTFNSSLSTQRQLTIAAENVERTLQRLEADFHAVPAVSNPCRDVLWEISQLVSTVHGASAPDPRQPAANVPLQRDAERLLLALRNFAMTLAPFQHRSPFYANLNRDVNVIYAQAASLARMARTSQRQSDLRQVIISITAQGREIGRQLMQADFGLRRGWWNVQHDLEQVAVAAGCSGDVYITSAHPVVLNQPGWHGFPGQISPGYQVSAVNRQVVAQTDQLLLLIDGYISSLRPVSVRSREATAMLNQTLDLRHEVLSLRQEASSGAFGSRLQYASRDVVRQYSDVASQSFVRLVGIDSTLNSPTWAQIGQLAYQIDKTIKTG